MVFENLLQQVIPWGISVRNDPSSFGPINHSQHVGTPSIDDVSDSSTHASTDNPALC